MSIQKPNSQIPKKGLPLCAHTSTETALMDAATILRILNKGLYVPKD